MRKLKISVRSFREELSQQRLDSFLGKIREDLWVNFLVGQTLFHEYAAVTWYANWNERAESRMLEKTWLNSLDDTYYVSASEEWKIVWHGYFNRQSEIVEFHVLNSALYVNEGRRKEYIALRMVKSSLNYIKEKFGKNYLILYWEEYQNYLWMLAVLQEKWIISEYSNLTSKMIEKAKLRKSTDEKTAWEIGD